MAVVVLGAVHSPRLRLLEQRTQAQAVVAAVQQAVWETQVVVQVALV
jgi:hypothetical protein